MPPENLPGLPQTMVWHPIHSFAMILDLHSTYRAVVVVVDDEREEEVYEELPSEVPMWVPEWTFLAPGSAASDCH